MNITVNVDEVSLDTVVAEIVAFDEDGDPYPNGERTVADLVAAQIMARLLKDDGYRQLATRVQEIRAEEIRAAVRPLIEEALRRPIRKTNTYGEATGAETTLTEVIIDEAQKAITKPLDSYNRDKGTFLSKTVADEVKKALSAEIADAVKKAREQVSAEIGQHVAAAVQAGLKAR